MSVSSTSMQPSCNYQLQRSASSGHSPCSGKTSSRCTFFDSNGKTGESANDDNHGSTPSIDASRRAFNVCSIGYSFKVSDDEQESARYSPSHVTVRVPKDELREMGSDINTRTADETLDPNSLHINDSVKSTADGPRCCSGMDLDALRTGITPDDQRKRG